MARGGRPSAGGADINAVVAQAVAAVHRLADGNVQKAPAAKPPRPRPAPKPAIHDLIVKPAKPALVPTTGPQPGPAAVKRIQRAQQAQSRARVHEISAKAIREQSVIPHGPAGFIANVAGNIAEDAFYTPAGIVAAGSAIGHDLAGVPRGDLNFNRTTKLGEQLAKQTYETGRHPSRRPGDTLLNAFALYTAAAKAGSGLAAASDVGRTGSLAKALAKGRPPGEIDLPGGAQALEYDNPALRPIQRARLKRVAKNIEAGKEAGPIANKLGMSPQSVVGREIRAGETVRSDIANAPIEAARKRVKKLTPAENTALRVIATEGNHALRDPEGVIDRHIKTHLRYATETENKADQTMNFEVAHDLNAALPVLKNPSRQFLAAVRAVRKVSRTSEGELVGAERLSAGGAKESIRKIAAEYGNPAAMQGQVPRGAFYYPTGEKFKLPTGKAGRGGPAGRTAGEFGIPPVQASRYLGGTLNKRTLAGLRKGVVARPGEAVATRAAGTAKLSSVERVQQQIISLGSKDRTHARQVYVRSGPITEADRARVAADLEEAQTGDATALVRAHKTMVDSLRGVPGKDKGVWVDPRYLKDMTAGPNSDLGKIARNFNLPFRFAGVYLRPAYVVTNRPQNWLMRHAAQGVMTRKYGYPTVHAMREGFGPELTAKMDAAGGETRTESYMPHQMSAGRRVERAVTNKITDLTDRDERFLGVAWRAHEAGFDTEAKLRKLFADNADKATKNKLVAISRRGRKDLVDFSSVTPGERAASDAIYFYPWLTRGSAWAGRFVAQHPIQSAALAALAKPGKQMEDKNLGPIPGWMKGYLSTPAGVVNPSSSNTFETPASIYQTLSHPSGPQAKSFGEDFGTPLLQALTTQPAQIPQKLAEQGTAPGLLLQRLGLLGKPSATFPHTGVMQALGPFIAGGFYPRKPDMGVVAKSAAKEKVPGAVQKSTVLGYEKKLKQTGIAETPEVKALFELAGKRAEARAKYPRTAHGRLHGDLDALLAEGKITTQIRDETLAGAQGMSEYALAQKMGPVNKLFDPTGALGRLNTAASRKHRGG